MVFLQVYTFGVRDGKEERETCPKSAHNRLTGISAPVDATHKSAPGLTVLKIFNTIISLNLSIRHYNTLKKIFILVSKTHTIIVTSASSICVKIGSPYY